MRSRNKRKNRHGADGNALKIFFISEAQPLQQFRQHDNETDARQIGAVIEIIENVFSVGVSEHHHREDAQERPEKSELDFSIGPPADADDKPGKKRSCNHADDGVSQIKKRRELKTGRHKKFAEQLGHDPQVLYECRETHRVSLDHVKSRVQIIPGSRRRSATLRSNS